MKSLKELENENVSKIIGVYLDDKNLFFLASGIFGVVSEKLRHPDALALFFAFPR